MGKMDPVQLQAYHSAIPNLPRVLMVLKHFREIRKKEGFFWWWWWLCVGGGIFLQGLEHLKWHMGMGSKCMACFVPMKMKRRELEYKL